jgi:hypothetical protein
MNLQDIRNEYLKMLDIIESAEMEAEGVTDEIDEQLYLLLDDVQGELIDKLESCASVRDSLLSSAQQIKARIQTWSKHKKRLEANAERIKEWMSFNMREAGLTKAETNLYKLGFGKKPAYARELDYNAFDEWVADGHGEGLFERQGPKPKKKREIVKQLKAGQEVPGFRLIDDEITLRIK